MTAIQLLVTATSRNSHLYARYGSKKAIEFADLQAQVLEKCLLRLLGGWRSKELARRFRTLFARKIELELSRSSSSLDRDDDISLVLEIQELISLLTSVLVHLLNSSSSRSTPCA
ncbi:hypothetical protein LWI29_026748 [Acer saccharum]|uniref:Uncharacterized protein n=1 Tax=Acer saccharum TaxID=4024 RepID=A0AA39T6L2_ACESA|nr:hypothetical protein LWI29_026748 [Acer saccharum]